MKTTAVFALLGGAWLVIVGLVMGTAAWDARRDAAETEQHGCPRDYRSRALLRSVYTEDAATQETELRCRYSKRVKG